MSILDGMNTGGVLFPIETAADEEETVGKERRMFLVGGPWGPLFPMGMLPVDGYEEEEDPNP